MLRSINILFILLAVFNSEFVLANKLKLKNSVINQPSNVSRMRPQGQNLFLQLTQKSKDSRYKKVGENTLSNYFPEHKEVNRAEIGPDGSLKYVIYKVSEANPKIIKPDSLKVDFRSNEPNSHFSVTNILESEWLNRTFEQTEVFSTSVLGKKLVRRKTEYLLQDKNSGEVILNADINSLGELGLTRRKMGQEVQIRITPGYDGAYLGAEMNPETYKLTTYRMVGTKVYANEYYFAETPNGPSLNLMPYGEPRQLKAEEIAERGFFAESILVPGKAQQKSPSGAQLAAVPLVKVNSAEEVKNDGVDSSVSHDGVNFDFSQGGSLDSNSR